MSNLVDQQPARLARLAYFALDVPHKGQASWVHINEIISNLRKLGWQIDLYAPEPTKAGVSRRPVAKALAFLTAIWRAMSRLRSYDALYVRAHPLAGPLTFTARMFGLTIAQEINGTEMDVIISRPWLRRFRPIVRWLYFSQYRVSDHLFPVAREMGDWLRANLPNPAVTVVPNAANTDLFRPVNRTPVKPFVVFFGGLAAWHGVDLMIGAVHSTEWPKDVELIVIGTGAREADIKQAEQAGAPIRCLGYQPYESIPGLIAGGLAGLIPITDPGGRSYKLTGMHPLKLYETLAAGLPAIVTDLPGQADLVRDERCGLVIPDDDPVALALAVAQIAADPAAGRAMGRRGAAIVQASHSWAARARDIDGVLRRAVARRKGAAA